MSEHFNFNITSPDTFVASLPHLLGYHPRDSLVAAWLHGGRVMVTQRLDLPGALDKGKAAELHAVVSRHEPTEVLLAAIGRVPASRLRSFASALGQMTPVVDAIVVDDGCWMSVMGEPGEEGSVPVPLDVSVTLAVDAAFALAGSAPAASRGDLELDCVPGVRLLDCDVLADIRSDAAQALGLPAHRELVVQAAATSATLDDEQVAWLGLAVHDVRVRDCVLWHLAWCEDNGRMWDSYRLWCAAVAVLPPKDAVPAATIAATCAWLFGDGTRAVFAVRAALSWDDEYSLAQLLLHAATQGASPQEWRELVRSVDYQTCLQGPRSVPAAGEPHR